MKAKKVLLCVSGGIAAFKAAALTSKLVQAGANVKVILTASSMQFITPLTFQALSRNDVYIDTFEEKQAEKIAHIDLADWADLVVVAPASANTIGKLAMGLADNMLTTTLLATTAPIFIAPAMNVHMYEHKAVQRNMRQLKADGYHFLDSDEGYLACGYVGKGRMQEPEQIIASLTKFFLQEQRLAGKKVLITAGPTIEKIDPVRYLSNFSSGKMGYALAEMAQAMGAEVTLISGPVSLQRPPGVRFVAVQSADEMFEATMGAYKEMDIVIGAAAVADYKPLFVPEKIKKTANAEERLLQLYENQDIMKAVGQKKDKQFLVVFAAETTELDQHARSKLERKNADMLIANNVSQAGAGFGVDTNIVSIYQPKQQPIALPILSKTEVASEILTLISEQLPIKQ